jgi:hypothetical protein
MGCEWDVVVVVCRMMVADKLLGERSTGHGSLLNRLRVGSGMGLRATGVTTLVRRHMISTPVAARYWRSIVPEHEVAVESERELNRQGWRAASTSRSSSLRTAFADDGSDEDMRHEKLERLRLGVHTRCLRKGLSRGCSLRIEPIKRC